MYVLVAAFDGAPPRTLPVEVLQHALYKRVFGRSDFEIVVTADNVMETVRQVHGRVYQFLLAGPASASRLVVREIDPATDTTLELLEPAEAVEVEAPLPRRLREIHSHWL